MRLDELVWVSREIAGLAEDCVILGEGNTSARSDESGFWVKASGTQLSQASEDTFVTVDLAKSLAALDGPDLSDSETAEFLSGVVLAGSLKPSTETFMHAYLLSLPGVEAVIHTHPTPLLSLLCLDNVEEIARQRLFPDEIVCCGPRACVVPYCDPGLALARGIRESVLAFVDEDGELPKTIWIRNHGLICVGKTGAEALTATRMSVKAARIWLGSLQSGRQVQTLSREQIERIHRRPDEHYRQRLLWREG